MSDLRRSAALMVALALTMPHGVYGIEPPRKKAKPRPTGPTTKRAKVKAARKQREASQ